MSVTTQEFLDSVYELNFYRNQHYSDSSNTESYKLANAINAILPSISHQITGCYYCKGVKFMSGAFNGTAPVKNDIDHLRAVSYDGDFNYCPVCGRRL